MSETRLRILFFAEGATLAHVARPALLAASLDPARFEATLARPASYAWVSDGGNADTRTLACQDSALFAQRLARGLPLYDTATLERYVVDDLALIDAIEPDVVVGDFRLSLSVSARLRDVPYVTICDAYWSPERPLRAVLPVLPFTRFTPIPLARLLFDALSPLAMRLHTLPLERLRARHGLPALGHDLRRCYTDADLRLFANFPALFPELVPRDDAAFLQRFIATTRDHPAGDLHTGNHSGLGAALGPVDDEQAEQAQSGLVGRVTLPAPQDFSHPCCKGAKP